MINEPIFLWFLYLLFFLWFIIKFILIFFYLIFLIVFLIFFLFLFFFFLVFFFIILNFIILILFIFFLFRFRLFILNLVKKIIFEFLLFFLFVFFLFNNFLLIKTFCYISIEVYPFSKAFWKVIFEISFKIKIFFYIPLTFDKISVFKNTHQFFSCIFIFISPFPAFFTLFPLSHIKISVLIIKSSISRSLTILKIPFVFSSFFEF